MFDWLSRLAGRHRSIRLRITALATVLVAVVLTAAAMALVALQRQQLTSNLDSSLEQRADTYEEALLDVGDGIVLGTTTDEDRAVQLVTASGQVIASTPNLDDIGPLREPLGAGIGQVIDDQRIPRLEDDVYRVLSRRVDGVDGVDGSAGPVDLHVAQNVDDLADTMRGLAIALGVAVPAVVVFVAALTWWLVGRTLRPVELIRAEVAHISGTDLHRRVPVSDQGDEIARLATTMNSMLDRVDGASRRQRQFVADASHELRTPLTRMRTEIEVDVSHPTDADPAATNRAVLTEIIGLQRLLEDLLFLARSDEHQTRQRHRTVDLDDIALTAAAAARAETTVEIDTTGVQAVAIDGDDGQLARMIENLLSNAVRHATSRVSVTLGETDERVVLAVSDDGPGVPPESRDRIFARFGRVDDARTRTRGGAGLGLAIVRDIVGRHGGTIHYDGTWGDGARFVVELPSTRRASRPSQR